MLLIWISQTAITSLSLEMYLKADRLVDCPNKLRSLVSDYHSPILVHYLFMQDFNAIQFLMSFIGPEHFLKCLLFNICPSIREKVSISQSFASILSLPEFKDTLVLQQVLILIHNALSEMRIVGDLKDPDSYFMERQFNHMLASECKTETDLRTTVYMDRNSFRPIQLSRRNNKFGGLKVDSACNTENPQNETTQKLSPKYLNPGCPFYYLNTIKETEFAFESLLCYYKLQVPDFVLPGVTGLREEFKGLEAFMFSEAFLDFILECFVNWYKNPELWKKDSPDLFLFILLILCLILRVYKDRSIRESYRDRMFDFFGKHPKLENRSLLEIIKNEVPNCQNPLVAVMIDRFIDLSHLGKRNE
ncbi:hypothetical protein RF11_13214 [Thelohanellus kitauei]|uniref:Uncharacterized protein n=1 Tax=Thelohanellus kitauei TaxID=669202 RepID=A0A0C2ITJ2_THEKT|nr:hypothetical protein RF11_13214 [Thelohanellus kitauei]